MLMLFNPILRKRVMILCGEPPSYSVASFVVIVLSHPNKVIKAFNLSSFFTMLKTLHEVI